MSVTTAVTAPAAQPSLPHDVALLTLSYIDLTSKEEFRILAGTIDALGHERYPLLDQVIRAQKTFRLLPPEMHTLHQQTLTGQPGRPKLCYPAVVLIAAFCHDPKEHATFDERLVEICNATGLVYREALSTKRHLITTTCVGREHPFDTEFTRETLRDLDYDEQLHVSEIDSYLTSRVKEGGRFPHPRALLKEALSNPAFYIHYTYFSEDNLLRLPIDVRWDDRDYGSCTQKGQARETNRLAFLTLILKHYPTLSLELSSHMPGASDAVFCNFSEQDSPFANPQYRLNNRCVVFKSPGTGPISLEKTRNRTRFLGRSLVNAILDSGKTLSQEDLNVALYVEFINSRQLPGPKYVQRLLENGANPHTLVARRYKKEPLYFYKADKAVQGVPLLYRAADHMRHMLVKKLVAGAAHNVRARYRRIYEKSLALLQTAGARYYPDDLLQSQQMSEQSYLGHYLDHLIYEFTSVGTPLWKEQFKSLEARIKKKWLPNALSLVRLFGKGRDPQVLSLCHQICRQSPKLLDQILADTQLLKWLVSISDKRDLTPFKTFKKDPREALQKALMLGLQNFCDDSDTREDLSDFSATLGWTVELSGFQRIGIKMDPQSPTVIVKFLQIVRTYSDSTAPSVKLAQLLKFLKENNLLDSPRDLVTGAIAYAEKSPTHQTLQLLLRNLLGEVNKFNHPAAATTAAAAT
jgi:hypothetical protein